MAIKKVKLPNNTVVDINDPRIPGVDSTPTSGSTNVVTSGGVYTALQNILSQIVNFEDVSTNQDGTLIITLSNGDTITVDLNHNHPQYPKYVHLASESAMPATPDSETMYLIDGGGGGGGGGSYTLPIASASTLGGIKVGDGLSINNSTGVLATVSKIVYLSNESQMPASPDANTLYAIYGTGGGSGGGISDVTLGGTTVVSNGVAVLPAYPTTLPASDVSAWAKASTKPTYTASEVGALPSTTTIPTALSQLSADSTHRVVTDTEKSTWNAKQSAITISSSEPTSSQGSNGDIWIVI